MNVQHVQVTHLVCSPGKIGIVTLMTVSTNVVKRNSVFNLLLDDLGGYLQLGFENPFPDRNPNFPASERIIAQCLGTGRVRHLPSKQNHRCSGSQIRLTESSIFCQHCHGQPTPTLLSPLFTQPLSSFISSVNFLFGKIELVCRAP